MFETYVRGEWLARRTEQRVKKFLDREESLEFDKLIASLESTDDFETKFLSQFKDKYWSAMCDYAHTGGRRIVFGANLAKTSTERTINMKAKSSKQSKKDKPAVKIKDLKPTKDAKGGALSAEEMTAMQQDLARRDQAVTMQSALIQQRSQTLGQITKNL